MISGSPISIRPWYLSNGQYGRDILHSYTELVGLILVLKVAFLFIFLFCRALLSRRSISSQGNPFSLVGSLCLPRGVNVLCTRTLDRNRLIVSKISVAGITTELWRGSGTAFSRPRRFLALWSLGRGNESLCHVAKMPQKRYVTRFLLVTICVIIPFLYLSPLSTMFYEIDGF
jgi:hypothetical protein